MSRHDDQVPLGVDTAAWVVLTALAVGVAAVAVAVTGGTVGAAASGTGWHLPPYSARTLVDLLTGGTDAVWAGASPAWVLAGIGAAGAASLTVAVTAYLLIASDLIGWTRGLAGPRELNGLRARTRAAARRARQLRPATLTQYRRRVPLDETGVLIGDLLPGGGELRTSWEDTILAICGPRAGKSNALAAQAVLRSPGPVVLTSNKADVYLVTRAARAKIGPVWVFDPQRIAYTPRSMWWDMLAEAATLDGARRLAGHFVTAAIPASTARRDFWTTAAENTLTALFHAAVAKPGGRVADVLTWLANPADREPVDVLRDAGRRALAEQLAGTIRGAVETREGIYETARQTVACLLDPAILAWVTPDPTVRQFRPAELVGGRGVVYLLSKHGEGAASGVIAALTDAILHAAIRTAEQAGGRLDPPLVPVLDEAANICRIADLPDLYSHLGSRGVVPVTILQSCRQGTGVWGPVGMDALWSAATIKVLGAGLDDADFADRISRLIGDHKVIEHTVSHSRTGRGLSRSLRRERILSTADIRAIPRAQALVLATGTRPALVRLRPWYEDTHAAALAAAQQVETAALTRRALAATGAER